MVKVYMKKIATEKPARYEASGIMYSGQAEGKNEGTNSNEV